MKKKINKKIPKYKFGAAEVSGAVSTAASGIAGAAGISQNSAVGGALKGLGAGLSSIPTPYTQIAGAALSTVGSMWGEAGAVDQTTGEIYEGNGLSKLFGRSSASLRRESNRIKNSIVDKELTAHLNNSYYSDPNNSMNMNVFAAAEGGIVPGEHYASRREVEVAADGTNAVRYGWDPRGKDTYHVYTNPDGTSTEGNMIFTEEGVTRPNGEKYSDAAEKIIKGTKEGSRLRQINLRKLANEMEEQKMNKEIKKVKKGIPAHEGGTNGKFDFENSFLYRQPDGTFVMQDINGKRTPVPEMMLPYIQGDEHGYYFGPQTGIAPSAGKWNGSMNFAKLMLNSKNIQKLKNTATKVFARNAKPATVNAVKNSTQAVQAEKAMLEAERQGTFDMWQRLGNKSGVPARTVETTVANRGALNGNLWNTAAHQAAADAAVELAVYNGMVKSNLPYWLTLSGMVGGAGVFLTHEATKNKQNSDIDNNTIVLNGNANLPHSTSTSIQDATNLTEVTDIPTTNENKAKVVNNSLNKPTVVKKANTKNTTLKTDQVENNQIAQEKNEYLDYTPVDSLSKFVETPNVGKLTPLSKELLDTNAKYYNHNVKWPTEENDSNWQDLAYRAAVLSQPLWGRAKAEPVEYTVPPYKYMPTAVDVSKQLRDVDQSYAMARYDFANNYRNTGAGMAAGVLAAANRANQMSAIRQYQTNAQNELIGKNVGIYNKWANDNATIMNNVYDKAAANRATARNINRQNAAAALGNYGKMRLEDKQLAMNNALLNLYAPMAESVLENPYTVINPLRKTIRNYGG